ncbi:hypothetical protein ACH4E7_28430 [Kitasatospora sp. NPDC018058]|uniref:hypothetical protein n=1 Tax=Kitasatospora sp. NPDC018058 TaxID=3364025 RepID=UPI0037C01A13
MPVPILAVGLVVVLGVVATVLQALQLPATAHNRSGTEAVHRFVDFFFGVLTLMALSGSVTLGLLAADRTVLTPRHRVVVQALHRAQAEQMALQQQYQAMPQIPATFWAPWTIAPALDLRQQQAYPQPYPLQAFPGQPGSGYPAGVEAQYPSTDLTWTTGVQWPQPTRPQPPMYLIDSRQNR